MNHMKLHETAESHGSEDVPGNEVVSDEISSTSIVNADHELNNQHQNVVFIYEEDIDYVNFDSSQIVAVD